VTLEEVAIHEIRGGKIVAERFYYDPSVLFPPAPPEPEAVAPPPPAEPEPEPVRQPDPEPVPQVEPQPEPKAAPKPTAVAEPKPAPEPAPTPTPAHAPEEPPRADEKARLVPDLDDDDEPGSPIDPIDL
jgi:hypothetical protein